MNNEDFPALPRNQDSESSPDDRNRTTSSGSSDNENFPALPRNQDSESSPDRVTTPNEST
jgi:hypothetical protein